MSLWNKFFAGRHGFSIINWNWERKKPIENIYKHQYCNVPYSLYFFACSIFTCQIFRYDQKMSNEWYIQNSVVHTSQANFIFSNRAFNSPRMGHKVAVKNIFWRILHTQYSIQKWLHFNKGGSGMRKFTRFLLQL